jgi:hypothetical protein
MTGNVEIAAIDVLQGIAIIALVVVGTTSIALVTLHQLDKWSYYSWYTDNGESFRDDIAHQIDILRADHGLSSVVVVDTVNGVSITKVVDIDDPSLKGFEVLLLNPDIEYVAIDAYMPYSGSFSSTQTCRLKIGVIVGVL